MCNNCVHTDALVEQHTDVANLQILWLAALWVEYRTEYTVIKVIFGTFMSLTIW